MDFAPCDLAMQCCLKHRTINTKKNVNLSSNNVTLTHKKKFSMHN